MWVAGKRIMLVAQGLRVVYSDEFTEGIVEHDHAAIAFSKKRRKRGATVIDAKGLPKRE